MTEKFILHRHFPGEGGAHDLERQKRNWYWCPIGNSGKKDRRPVVGGACPLTYGRGVLLRIEKKGRGRKKAKPSFAWNMSPKKKKGGRDRTLRR